MWAKEDRPIPSGTTVCVLQMNDLPPPIVSTFVPKELNWAAKRKKELGRTTDRKSTRLNSSHKP